MVGDGRHLLTRLCLLPSMAFLRHKGVQAGMGSTLVLGALLYTLQFTHGTQRRWLICAIPSVQMLFMSLVAYSVTVPTDVMSAFQHLAAGLLVSAVSVELVPTMMGAPSDASNMFGMVVGFAAGIGMLTLMSTLCGGEGVEDEEEEEAMARTPRGLTNIEHAKRAALQATPPYPAALMMAVTTDASIDGLLVGVASGSSLRANAGLILALALAIEMGFLGLTFASTMRKQPPLRGFFSILAPPLVLQLGALIGAVAAEGLAQQPATHTALIAFGSSALLYLVVVELLHEAHAAMEQKHIWWVELMFFVGFLLAIVLEKLMGGAAQGDA